MTVVMLESWRVIHIADCVDQQSGLKAAEETLKVWDERKLECDE
jgi:hypothetical protein